MIVKFYSKIWKITYSVKLKDLGCHESLHKALGFDILLVLGKDKNEECACFVDIVLLRGKVSER